MSAGLRPHPAVRISLILLSCAFLLCGRTAFALDPALEISQYAHTSWKISDGFTKGIIHCMAQTPDGYLWLGTEFGLYRFDGVRAVAWQPPAGELLPSNDIRRLLVTHDGTLWIGTFKGLVSWKDGKLTHYAEPAGLGIISLLEDHEGTVWVGSYGDPTGRLCAIHNGSVQCSGQDGTLGQFVSGLYEDAKGNLWVGVQNGLWRWKPGPPQFYSLPGNVDGIRAFAEDADGTLLIATSGGIQRFVDGKTRMYPLTAALPTLAVQKMLRDGDGSLWIGTRSTGLVHVHNGRTDVFSKPDGLSDNFVLNLFGDREGNIWAATVDGLDRFRDFAVATFKVKQGLSHEAVLAVLADRDGSVWLSSASGLDRWNNDKFASYGKEDRKLTGNVTNSLFQDSRGRIWVCTLEAVGYLENGKFVSVSGMPGGLVFSITEDGAGNLWFANQAHGLLRLSTGGEVQQTPWATLGHKDAATALASDSAQGGLWIGFSNGGISYFRDGQVRASYSTADGLGDGQVTRFRFDPDGTLWASTQGGLSRLKNRRIATLTSKNGLPCDPVHWVIQDNDHAFWLNMPCGLVRMERSEVDAWAVAVDKEKAAEHLVRVTVFDNSDGVRSSSRPGGIVPAVTRSTDGRLWFRALEGVSIIDPHHLAFNKLPPPVHIEQITADRKAYDALAQLRFPPLIRDVQIDYTALSLVAPEKVLFRYMLEGFDRDWQEAGNRRQVFYTNLPPRHYRFRVKACNNSGVWNEEGATLDFAIAPAYYQTWWFGLSCMAAVLALLWALYQLRLRQVAAQVRQRLEGRFEERERIARELHDTLLQSFQGILLYFQAAINLLPGRPNEAKERLERAADQAQQAITEGRDAVQGLRSSMIETNDLAAALNSLGAELAANPGGQNTPVFGVQVEGASRDLHPILRDDVFRIAGEALRNAFLHAQASRIEAEIHYDDRQLRVRIRDDGRGIDPQIVTEKGRPGHWGLRGMHERVKRVGGNLGVWSKPDSGTEIELTIPASTAYATSTRRRFRLSRKGETTSD